MNKIKLKPLNLEKYNNKQKYSKLSNNLPIILSLGKEIIELELNLTFEEKEKYLKSTENILIEDLIFLQHENFLWKKIKLKSTNFTLNTLIYMNKITRKKIPIEYISFSFPNLNFNENFLIEMINFVTESNGIYFNESSIFKNKSSFEIKFSLFIENELLKTFELAKKKLKQNDENSLNENSNVFNNIKFESDYYDFFFIHFNEILTSINDNFIFPIFDFYNFLLNLKFRFNLKIIIFFDDLRDLFNMNENYIDQTFNIIKLTDVFFWEKKNFVSNIQILLSNFSDYKNCLKIFQRTFNKTENKLNVIINNFSNVDIFEYKNNTEFQKYNFNISPFEKINHSNYLQIQDYKKILQNNNNLFVSLFLAGFLEKFFKFNKHNKKFQIEIIFPCYLKAFELVKKMFFLKINNFNFVQNDDFFIVNLDKNVINYYIQFYKKKSVENNFVLDCVHKNRSSLRDFLFKNSKNFSMINNYNNFNNNNFNNNNFNNNYFNINHKNNDFFSSFNSTKNKYQIFANKNFTNKKFTKNNSLGNIFYKSLIKKNYDFQSLNNSIYKNIFVNNLNNSKIFNINVKKKNFSEYLTNNNSNSNFFEK